MEKAHIQKNLRRSLLRGHPWVYRQALREPLKMDRAGPCQVFDSKGELGWAIYDPHSPLSLRILGLEKKAPTQNAFAQRVRVAREWRQSLVPEATNAFRCLNGEGDLLPGLVCDIYDSHVVLQFDGQGPQEFWREFDLTSLFGELGQNLLIKARGGEGLEALAGGLPENKVEINEKGARFLVDLVRGQKTGFFLDQRENRFYLRQWTRGLRVLNLFSYSGGFSISAGLGGSDHVTSVDLSKGAIADAQENWSLNDLPSEKHEGVSTDVFEYLSLQKQKWDVVVVDPPSMASSEKQKEKAMAKYIELFAEAARKVSEGGHLCLSSCSSHIPFSDFQSIVVEALSRARRRGQVMKISGQGEDHPFPHACPELRYLKFYHLRLN